MLTTPVTARRLQHLLPLFAQAGKTFEANDSPAVTTSLPIGYRQDIKCHFVAGERGFEIAVEAGCHSMLVADRYVARSDSRSCQRTVVVNCNDREYASDRWILRWIGHL